MPRRIPQRADAGIDFDNALMAATTANSAQQLAVRVRLVTPMLGGGYKAGHVDDVTPISAKGIRGQLRFWWRVTCGASFETVEEMALWETAIFGDSTSPSPFDLAVNQIGPISYRLREERRVFGFDRYGAESYALFSARKEVPALLKEGCEFSLGISLPGEEDFKRRRDSENASRRKQNLAELSDSAEDLRACLSAALWGWLNFGGVGSRTRRGLGALQVVEVQPPDQLLASSLGRNDHVRHRPAADVYFGDSIGPRVADATRAWATVLDRYRSFRQRQRDSKMRNGQTVQEGRSWWPEPDSVRRITGCHLPRHPPAGGEAVNAFPRAVLGLPIIFWFKDRPHDGLGNALPPDPVRDPVDSTLLPMVRQQDNRVAPGERMASPVITRPLWVNEAWHPGFVVLHRDLSKLEAHLAAEGVDGNGQEVETPHSAPHSEISGASLAGLKALNGKPDAMEAFIKWAGFTKLDV